MTHFGDDELTMTTTSIYVDDDAENDDDDDDDKVVNDDDDVSIKSSIVPSFIVLLINPLLTCTGVTSVAKASLSCIINQPYNMCTEFPMFFSNRPNRYQPSGDSYLNCTKPTMGPV